MQTGMIRFEGLFVVPKRHLAASGQAETESAQPADKPATKETLAELLADPGAGWRPTQFDEGRDAFVLATEDAGRTAKQDLAMLRRLKEAGASFSYVPFVPADKDRDDHLMLAADTVVREPATAESLVKQGPGKSFSYLHQPND